MPSQHRIYLDSSAISRPFDDQSQRRILVETQALLAIIGMIHRNEIELVTSEVLEDEASLNPLQHRRMWVQTLLGRSASRQSINDVIAARARELELSGVKAVDALHAATAETAHVTHFITCDDRFIRRYSGPLLVMRPPDFVIDVLGAS